MDESTLHASITHYCLIGACPLIVIGLLLFFFAEVQTRSRVTYRNLGNDVFDVFRFVFKGIGPPVKDDTEAKALLKRFHRNKALAGGFVAAGVALMIIGVYFG